MTFREIKLSDIPEIFEVRYATWHTDNPLEDMTRLGITPGAVREMMESDSHKGWLCEEGGKTVGFSMGNRLSGEMWVIAVLKEYEDRGLGKKLLGLVENWLWSEGWDEIWLTTDTDPNDRAVGFYHHLGWEHWKMDKDRYLRKYR